MPHQCPYCHKEFSRSKDIPRHIRTERSKEVNQPEDQRPHAQAIIRRPGRPNVAELPAFEVPIQVFIANDRMLMWCNRTKDKFKIFSMKSYIRLHFKTLR
jgi:hypothetical protein